MTPTNDFFLGAIAAMSLLAALFFLRFWRMTDDRLFLLFSTAFGLEGLNRIALASTANPSEGQPLFYVVRLLSFLIILGAILQKNLPSRGR